MLEGPSPSKAKGQSKGGGICTYWPLPVHQALGWFRGSQVSLPLTLHENPHSGQSHCYHRVTIGKKRRLSKRSVPSKGQGLCDVKATSFLGYVSFLTAQMYRLRHRTPPGCSQPCSETSRMFLRNQFHNRQIWGDKKGYWNTRNKRDERVTRRRSSWRWELMCPVEKTRERSEEGDSRL